MFRLEDELTRQYPRIELVEIDFSNNLEREIMASNFPAQILHQKFFIRRVKPETGWQT